MKKNRQLFDGMTMEQLLEVVPTLSVELWHVIYLIG